MGLPAPAISKPPTAGVYRPRRPHASPVFKVVADHLEGLLEEYEERHRKTWGALRPVGPRTAEKFLRCGLLEHGFARIRCDGCKNEFLLAFSCRTRGLCCSCEAKRCTAWARWVAEDVALDVAHRQVVLTLPKMLRPLFRYDRSLLTRLAGWVNECLCDLMQLLAAEPCRPGCLVRLELAGNLLNLQPHLHLIVTDGAFSLDGARSYPMREELWELLEELVRHKVLRELHGLSLLTTKRRRLLLSWRHSGFSVHCGTVVPRGEEAGLERLARYVRRFHLAESRVVYDEAEDRVIYSSGKHPHPGFKANFRIFDAQDFVATVLGFVPDPYRHETIAYGEYSNVVRGKRRSADAVIPSTATSLPRRRVSTLWRELLKRIYEVDPLLCPCGREMRIVAFVVHPSAVAAILAHLGLQPPPPRPPRRRRARPPPCPVRPSRSPRRTAIDPDLDPPHDDRDDNQLPPWWDDDSAFSQLPEHESE